MIIKKQKSISEKIIYLLLLLQFFSPIINYYSVIQEFPFHTGDLVIYGCSGLIVIISSVKILLTNKKLIINKLDIYIYLFITYITIRYVGSFSFINLIPIVLFSQFFLLKQLEIELIKLIKFILLASLSLSVVALIVYCAQLPVNLSVFGNTTLLGNYLLITLPFCLILKYQSKVPNIILSFIIFLGIVISNDKSSILIAIIELLALASFLLYSKFRLKIFSAKGLRYIIIFNIIFFSILSFFIVNNKRTLNAMKGRFFIQETSLTFIKDSPLIGIGLMEFRRKFNIEQANEFNKKDYFVDDLSEKEVLAGNTFWLFNEYLQLLIEGGVISLILLCLVIYYSFKSAKGENKIISLSIFNFLILGLNDYPFHIPYNYILILTVYLILQRTDNLSCKIKQEISGSIVLLLIIFTTYFVFHQINYSKDLFYWGKAKKEESVEQKIIIMNKVSEKLHKNGPFLYDLSLCYLLDDQPDLAIFHLENGIDVYPHSDLYLLLGDAYNRNGEFKNAEKCYLISSNIMPIKITPRLKLFNLYSFLGEKDKAYKQAKIIQKSPAKIWSSEWQGIKNNINEYLMSLEQNLNNKSFN